MDGIISVAHFCETHGPCIILTTQQYDVEPQQKPHSLVAHRCDACESLPAERAFVSREEQEHYITTRTPLQQEEAFLLRQAAVRSLSCERENTAYFGDNERGHVFSRCFSLHDTSARGFLRKYAIVVLMRDKLRLLHAWSILSTHIDKIAGDLVEWSAIASRKAQGERSQRSIRQSEGSASSIARSLPELTGKPGIYAYLHLRFTWLLKCPVAVEITRHSEKPHILSLPTPFSLRSTQLVLGKDVFSNVLMAFLHGASLQCCDQDIVESFHSIWPEFAFASRRSRPDVQFERKPCEIVKDNDQKWVAKTMLDLKVPKSKLQKDLEALLSNESISDKVLQHQIKALTTHWINASNVLLVCPEINLNLTKSLNITQHDLPLINATVSKCCQMSCIELTSRLNSLYQK